MNFNRFSPNSSKLLFTLSLLWMAVLLMIGTWWIYVMANFENFSRHSDRLKISKMIIWEGGSFLILLILLSISLFILYLKDKNKTKSLHVFFASLTHELKTPLASIRLQSEVINEILTSKNDPTLNKIIKRLIEDTTKLETQMDKILQLSRVELGGELNLSPLSLSPFLKNFIKNFPSPLQIEIIEGAGTFNIEVDEFALELILKNLFENTRTHTQSKKILITLSSNEKHVLLNYKDFGHFDGDIKKLGTLFYKYNSQKGSGIGLYLIAKLLWKMNGDLTITKTSSNLSFNLFFKKSEDYDA